MKPNGLEAILVVNQPDKQDGLTAVIPRGQVPVRYINKYHAEYDVPCAFCDKHTPHRKGFTAEMADGRIALCGIDCGRFYFGEETARNFEKDIEDQIRLERERRIIQGTLEHAPTVLSMFTDEVIDLENDCINTIQKLSVIFKEEMQYIRFSDQGDFIYSETRTRRIEEMDRNGRMRKKTVEENIPRFRVSAATLLRDGAPRIPAFRAAKNSLERWILSAEKATDAAEIKPLIDQRSRINSQIKDGREFLSQCQRLLSVDNMIQFEKTTKKMRYWKQIHIAEKAGRIEVKVSSGERFDIPASIDARTIEKLPETLRT